MSGDGLEVRRLDRGGDGLRATVRVDPGSPWFDGHFPGEPVLPAMAQIGLLAGLGDGSAVALPNLRLAGPIHPGDEITVHLADPAPDGGATFRIEKDGKRITSGSMRWGALETDPPEPPGSLKEANRPEPPGSPEEANRPEPPGSPEEANRPEPPGSLEEANRPEPPRSPEEAEGRHEGRGPQPSTPTDDAPSPTLLPHAPPSRLAHEIVYLAADHLLCRGSVPAANAAVHEGQAGPWMALELAAQAAGLLQAAGEGGGGKLRVGYIVRIRDAHFLRPTLPAEAPLLARVEHQGGGGPLSLYGVRVELEGADGDPLVATGTLGTFVPPE